MSEIAVRTATVADAAAVVGIDRDGFDPATTPGSAPGADTDPWARHDPNDVLVAELDGHVVGYLTLGRPTSLPSNAHVWQVTGLAVHPDVRRRGEFVIDGVEVDDVLMARRLG